MSVTLQIKRCEQWEPDAEHEGKNYKPKLGELVFVNANDFHETEHGMALFVGLHNGTTTLSDYAENGRFISMDWDIDIPSAGSVGSVETINPSSTTSEDGTSPAYARADHKHGMDYAIPKITTGTSNPSGGSNGDIYIKYYSS